MTKEARDKKIEVAKKTHDERGSPREGDRCRMENPLGGAAMRDEVITHCKGVAAARKARDEAVAAAWKVYNKATGPAWKAYNKAVAPARKVYAEAVAAAEKACDKAREGLK